MGVCGTLVFSDFHNTKENLNWVQNKVCVMLSQNKIKENTYISNKSLLNDVKRKSQCINQL